MTRTKMIKSLMRFTGAGTIRLGEVAKFLGDGNPDRVKKKYLQGLEKIHGGRYLIDDVADRLIVFFEEADDAGEG